MAGRDSLEMISIAAFPHFFLPESGKAFPFESSLRVERGTCFRIFDVRATGGMKTVATMDRAIKHLADTTFEAARKTFYQACLPKFLCPKRFTRRCLRGKRKIWLQRGSLMPRGCNGHRLQFLYRWRLGIWAQENQSFFLLP